VWSILIFAYSFLYTLFIAVDANFKLKGKDRKLQDVDFAQGTSVYVNEVAYQKHIKNYTDQPEVSQFRPILLNY
jgi:hypothetical protein